LDSSLLVIGVAVAAVICGLYLLCWFLSKKNKVAWFIVALVLFSLDTLLMLMGGIVGTLFIAVYSPMLEIMNNLNI
jgi:hypothetical protein